MAWWIKEWSRELGRGRIEGTLADPLDFDASVALVDDFRIGEQVHVEVERQGEGWRVTKIAPDDPRFEPRTPTSSSPALDPDCEKIVRFTLERVRLQETYRPAAIAADTLVLRGEEAYAYPPPSDELVLGGLRYAEVATPMEVKSLRLSRPEERDYLATRVDDFSPEDVAITIVDTQNRFFFVVCASIDYRPAVSAASN